MNVRPETTESKSFLVAYEDKSTDRLPLIIPLLSILIVILSGLIAPKLLQVARGNNIFDIFKLYES